MKHLSSDIWELRPIDNRILFAYWENDTFIFLHHFVKKTNKTPSREIEQAKKNLKNLLKGVRKMNKYVSSLTTWDEFEKTLELTDEELTEINLKVQIVGEIINARRDKDITQKALEELSGVKQPVIARLEGNDTDPKLTTILKLLKPLGKTLQVVDLPKKVQ